LDVKCKNKYVDFIKRLYGNIQYIQNQHICFSFYRATACNATRGIAMRMLSVCPSVKRVIFDKTKETCVHIIIPRGRSFILVFWQEEWLVGATPCTWNFGLNWPCWSENADLQTIFVCSASAVTPSENSSINTNRKSSTRFPMSLRWTSYVAPIFLISPQMGAKTQNGCFPAKIALHLKKVCYKVSLCEYCQRQSCKAFTVLLIRAKVIGGAHPLKGKFSC